MSIVALQKELYLEVQEKIDTLTDEESKREPLTPKEYHPSMQLPSGDAVPKEIDYDSLAEKLAQKKMLFFSQYQTLPDCRIEMAKILQIIVNQHHQRPVVVFLDRLLPNDQEFLDDFNEGNIDLPTLTSRLFSSKELGARYERSLLSLFKVESKTQALHFVAAKPSVDASMEEADHFLAEKIESSLTALENPLLIALVGERRLMEGRLYDECEKFCRTETIATVLQASEEVYWSVAQNAENDNLERIDFPEAMQWTENLYSTVFVPPLVKLDSFVTWSNHQEAWCGFPADSYLAQARQQLRRSLGFSASDLEKAPEVYCCAEYSLLRRLRKNEFTEEERQALKRQITQQESFYLPRLHIIYLASLDGFHIGEEIGHSLRRELAGEKTLPELSAKGTLYFSAIHEAAGFLASKTLTPGRKAQKGDGKIARQLHDRRQRHWEPSREEVIKRSHQAGYGLGELLFKQWQLGLLEVTDLQPLFTTAVANDEEAFDLYSQIYQRTEQVLFSSPHTLKERLHVFGSFYFLLLFFPALLWGQARGLFNFPEPWQLNFGRDLGLTLGATALVSGASYLLNRYARPFKVLGKLLGSLMGPLTQAEVFLLAAFSALGEEMLFRGVLQAELGWVVASVLFGIVHFVADKRFIPWTLFAIVVGFILGGLYILTGNLLAPITAHLLINWLNGSLLVKQAAAEKT